MISDKDLKRFKFKTLVYPLIIKDLNFGWKGCIIWKNRKNLNSNLKITQVATQKNVSI